MTRDFGFTSLRDLLRAPRIPVFMRKNVHVAEIPTNFLQTILHVNTPRNFRSVCVLYFFTCPSCMSSATRAMQFAHTRTPSRLQNHFVNNDAEFCFSTRSKTQPPHPLWFPRCNFKQVSGLFATYSGLPWIRGCGPISGVQGR
jgi:hypothetical protein